ncbi:MAG: methyltransferase domain-containing protein [Labilithrix sp.]|nr:methyltransferase domain-containing protein [Labilithrix sp.]
MIVEVVLRTRSAAYNVSDMGTMLEHYMGQDEGTRLTRTGHGRLEQLRTRELLTRHLPAAPARVLDIGGGTGVHAAWLVAQGYNVHLIDPVPIHVERAREHHGVTAAEGDARNLVQDDASADAVLLLGPLYHLVERADRLTALREAHRVLRPGGIVAVAAITRYMALLTYCADGELNADRLRRLLPTLSTGRYDPSLDFTDAYFHHPEELATELRQGGFEDVRVFGVEGPGWTAVDAAGADGGRLMDSALLCARALEEDPAMLSANAHLLAVGRRLTSRRDGARRYVGSLQKHPETDPR